MAKKFEAKDPRGVTIYCEEDQWTRHIVNPSTGHPIMEDNVDAIIETITSPEVIYESHDSLPSLNYREVYCKKSESSTYYFSNAPYTKVVVTTCGGSGEVITAYPARNAEGGTKGDAIYREQNEN
ncbi:hypothetical protein [Flavonifractor sp. An82]|uniref:hypothetical protein n=1 Tax=Flavonifractor sp. An82 TaxID=1965660 RepID=UPI0011236F40|nr:hypothetical protein [Flavonifractor sp. An82]